MGCTSSKHLPLGPGRRTTVRGPVVSITFSTYGGVIDLHPKPYGAAAPAAGPQEKEEEPESSGNKDLEVINAWEIMARLEEQEEEEEDATTAAGSKRSAARRKNNTPFQRCSDNSKPGPGDIDNDSRVFRPYNSIENSKLSPGSPRIVRKPGGGGGMSSSKARSGRGLGPRSPRSHDPKPKCPLVGAADAVVLYTISLSAIRRTLDECDAVRAAIKAIDVKVIKRNVFMDLGYRDELRLRLGATDVPAVFVRGSHVGGAAEVLKLAEEGRLRPLLEGLPPRPRVSCACCADAGFVMCRHCNGSRKVFDAERNKTSKCDECNENGLVRCGICS